MFIFIIIKFIKRRIGKINYKMQRTMFSDKDWGLVSAVSAIKFYNPKYTTMQTIMSAVSKVLLHRTTTLL